jgi:hypothetical protein
MPSKKKLLIYAGAAFSVKKKLFTFPSEEYLVIPGNTFF